MRIFVTGGAGFSGSAVCRHLVADCGATVLNVDKMTSASHLGSLDQIAMSPRYRLVKADICERGRVAALMRAFEPDAVIHLAGDSNGDSAGNDTGSIGPSAASLATWSLLTAASAWFEEMPEGRRDGFRFVHAMQGFDRPAQSGLEATAITRAWRNTYGLPVIISRACALVGPFESLDGLLPQLTLAGIAGLPMALEGDGGTSRQWLHVEDHARALVAMARSGRPGSTYAVGSGEMRTDLQIAERIAAMLDRYAPEAAPHAAQIRRVANAPARTGMEAIEPVAFERELSWRPARRLDAAIASTVHWYLENEEWWRPLRDAPFDAQMLGQCRSA